MINGKQNVKLESGFISSKNYSRQIPVPLKTYADFECILKSVNSDIMMLRTQENIKTMFLVVLLIRLCMLIINIARKLFCTEEEMLITNLLD